MSAARTINVEIKGIQEVTRALKSFGEDFTKGLKATLDATGLEVVTDIRRAIERGPKSGFTYYRIPGDKYMTIRKGSADGPIVAVFKAQGKQGLSLTHRSSAPGEAPATDTGALATSVNYSMPNNTTVVIQSRLPYAAMLEFGTMKIEKRPAWIPASERAKPRLQARIERLIAQTKAKAEKTTK